MGFIQTKLKGNVPKGAKIFAGLLLIINGIVLGSLVMIMNRPDILREAFEGSPLLTEGEIQALLASAPLQLAVSVLLILGLILLIMNRRWGFVLYALPTLYGAVNNYLEGNSRGALSSLLQFLVMALLIFLVRSGPSPARRQELASNYSYNVDQPKPGNIPEDPVSSDEPTDHDR